MRSVPTVTLERPEAAPPKIFGSWAAKVQIIGRADDCFRWTGYINRHGYGRFNLAGKIRGAHVVAHLWFVGPVPKGLDVSHTCPGGGNRWCVNPRHLVAETRKENVARAIAAGRIATGERHGTKTHPESVYSVKRRRGDAHWTRATPERHVSSPGERNGMATLTEADVREIRRLVAEGAQQKALATRYSVSAQGINAIVKRRTWRHVE